MTKLVPKSRRKRVKRDRERVGERVGERERERKRGRERVVVGWF
jgi:hypothetical protein